MKKFSEDSIIAMKLGIITARFLQIADTLCPNSDLKFSKYLNINRTTLSALRNKKAFVNVEFIAKLIEKEHNINLNWLFKGEGKMIVEKYDNSDANSQLLSALQKQRDAIDEILNLIK